MDNYQQITKDLKKFGLSENEASIYLFLVARKELRIQEIAKLTQIPRSSVYESLKVLTELGLIEKVIDHKFIRIRPYPISAIKHGLNEKLVELETQMTELDNLGKTIPVLANEASQSTVIKYYEGVSGARQLFWNTLNAKSIVCVYSAFGRSKFVGKKFYIDFVWESREKAIKEKVLINPSERAFSLIKRDTGSSLARTKTDDIRVLEKANLLIEGETFIYDNIYAQVKLDGLEINGFEVEGKYFTDMQRSIFETLWNQAKSISPFL